MSSIAAGGCTIQPRVCGDYETIDAETVATPDTTPRMRGLLFNALSWANTFDTTPRMRGLPPTLTKNEAVRRYNPAYAGTTCLM